MVQGAGITEWSLIRGRFPCQTLVACLGRPTLRLCPVWSGAWWEQMGYRTSTTPINTIIWHPLPLPCYGEGSGAACAGTSVVDVRPAVDLEACQVTHQPSIASQLQIVLSFPPPPRLPMLMLEAFPLHRGG